MYHISKEGRFYKEVDNVVISAEIIDLAINEILAGGTSEGHLSSLYYFDDSEQKVLGWEILIKPL